MFLVRCRCKNNFFQKKRIVDIPKIGGVGEAHSLGGVDGRR